MLFILDDQSADFPLGFLHPFDLPETEYLFFCPDRQYVLNESVMLVSCSCRKNALRGPAVREPDPACGRVAEGRHAAHRAGVRPQLPGRHGQ